MRIQIYQYMVFNNSYRYYSINPDHHGFYMREMHRIAVRPVLIDFSNDSPYEIERNPFGVLIDQIGIEIDIPLQVPQTGFSAFYASGGFLSVWDWRSSKSIFLPLHPFPIRALHLSHDSSLLISTDGDTIAIWSTDDFT
jgi:hypothetical protein